MAARGAELLLGVSGVGYFFLGSDDEEAQAQFLALWALVAVGYVVIGAVAVRRLRAMPVDVDPPWSTVRGALGRRVSFLLTVAASLTGVSAALTVLADTGDDDFSPLVRAMGVLAMICAWTLLHSGYARFYSFWPDWRFPSCPRPGPIEFLYFSFTVGVSFASSDVEVHGRALRWHVLVHSVISFFYNAIVLAVAVSIITGG